MGEGSCLLCAWSPLLGARPLMAMYIFSWNIFLFTTLPRVRPCCYGDPLGKMHMPDFIKSSESLEHDQLGKSERWCSGSPRKSLFLSRGASWWWSCGQGPGKQRGAIFTVPFQPRVKLSAENHTDGVEDRGAAAGRSHMGAMLTQGCLGPEGSAQSGQQGSRPSRAARMAWELDPEQLTMEQSPQGGGKEGETTGCQTPKLSTKNGRFEPCECCPWRSKRTDGEGRQSLPERRRGCSDLTHQDFYTELPCEILFDKRAPLLKWSSKTPDLKKCVGVWKGARSPCRLNRVCVCVSLSLSLSLSPGLTLS